MALKEDLKELGLQLVKSSIGGGGSAVVHKTRVVERLLDGMPESGSLIAVKQYKPSLVDVEGQWERIEQEAFLGQSIDHPNIIRTYGLRKMGSPPRPCLLLQWIDGPTLEAWYRHEKKPIEWEKIRSICGNIVAGVAELHSRGVRHRDIKPENVMMRSDGTAVLMDMGVAEITADNEHTLHTKIQDFVGSARYASRQFILGEGFEFADDVYSIGATFLLLFTGRVPYAEIERKPVLPIMVTQGPPEIGKLQDNVPSPMKVLLQGCLHARRERRPSLGEILECLASPESAKYISTELERQTKEQRSYEILRLDARGGGFYADLAGDSPPIGEEYTVVRRDKPLAVPSYQREIQPERWIATAELRHMYQNVGHFKLLGKKWQPARHDWVQSMVGGQWVDYDKVSEDVQPGDLVVKNPAR